MPDFLDEIVEYKRDLIKKKREYFDRLKGRVAREKLTRYGLFKQAIAQPGKINLIAEIKKASPSRGLLCPDFNVLRMAKIYVDHGAAAISILTEDRYFLGKTTYLTQVSENFSIPLLTKDFILDEGQIYEAFAYGASAVLLIVAVLKDDELKKLMQAAVQLDLDCLVEVHDEKELDRALKAEADIIGINNRDLHTFQVDLKVAEHLIPKIPKDKVIVAESGIKNHEEVVMLKDLGAHAVLIGETFICAPDMAQKIKEVMGT